MSQAILSTPESPYFSNLADSPFFDSSINLTQLFAELHGKVATIERDISTGITTEATRTLRQTMFLLWRPRAWRVECTGIDITFDSVRRTIGGGGYYPKFYDVGGAFSASGVVGAYYIQLPTCENPTNPEGSLYDPGWFFSFNGAVNRNLISSPLPECGTLTVTCGALRFTETLYGVTPEDATLTAFF